MTKLLATGKTDLLTNFISKKNNRPFKAFMAIGKDKKVSFEFPPRESKAGKKGPSKSGEAQTPAPKLDFTGKTSLGKCPACGGQVFEGPETYLCEKSQAEVKPCKFKVGKVILEQPVEPAQLSKLLTDQKTDLLPKFISTKTGRPFAAFLVLQGKTKVGFEFPEREE